MAVTVTGFLLLRPWFNTRPIPVGFVVDKVALGQVCLRVLLFLPILIIPQMLHIWLSLMSYNLHRWLHCLIKHVKKELWHTCLPAFILYMKLPNGIKCSLMVQICMNSCEANLISTAKGFEILMTVRFILCDAVYWGTQHHFGGTECFPLQDRVG
jgi:hypothetical protein